MAEETPEVVAEPQEVAVVCTMDATFLRDGSRLQAGQSKMIPADEADELEAQGRVERA